MLVEECVGWRVLHCSRKVAISGGLDLLVRCSVPVLQHNSFDFASVEFLPKKYHHHTHLAQPLNAEAYVLMLAVFDRPI